MPEEYREHRRKQLSTFSLIDSIFPIVNLKKDYEVKDIYLLKPLMKAIDMLERLMLESKE